MAALLPRRPGALVFDLDGTLIDSRADIRTAVNEVRGELGLPALPLEAVVKMVGEGARTLLERALADSSPPPDPAAIDGALRAYLRSYERVCLEETKAYPGVEELLAELAPRFALAVLSNKGEALSRKVLTGLGLASRFREILGGDSFPSRKPDPVGLLAITERLGLSPGELLMVGDTWVDGAAARAAGCPFALVEWGFPQAEQIRDLPSDLRVAYPGELLAALA